MVSRVFISLCIVGFCCVSTQDVSSDLSGVHEENVTEAIGTSETVQSSSPKPAFTKTTSARKEKGIKKSKVEKLVSLNQTSGLPFSELSSTLKVITPVPQDAINTFGLGIVVPDGISLDPGRSNETVSVATETTSKDLVTSANGVTGQDSKWDSDGILNTVKENVTERMPDNLDNVSDLNDYEVISEKLDFKLQTKKLDMELLSLNGSDLITVHAEYKNESSATVKIVPEDQGLFMDVTVDQVKKDVEKIESKQEHLDFNHHLSGLQIATVHKDDEIGSENRQTETTKDKKTSTVYSVDENVESVEVVLGKPELDKHSSDNVFQATIAALKETQNEPLFVEWVGVEQPDLKLESNMIREMFKGRGQPKNGTAHFRQNIGLKSDEGKDAFDAKKNESNDSGLSDEILPKITSKHFKEPLNGVTLDHMSKGLVHHTLDMFYKTVKKTKNESRRIGLNSLETDDTMDPVLTADEFGLDSIEKDETKNASVLAADVTDRMKSTGVELKIHSSIGYKDLGGLSSHSPARSPAHPSTHPSRTSLGSNEADDILVIEARRGHKKTDVIGVTLIDRIVENRIPVIGGRGPANFPEPTGDSALKVAKGGSEDSSNDDSGATGVHEGGKVEVVKAAAGPESYAEELSKWGSVSWAFASGFVTSLLATGLCYLVVKSRRTSTYRIREIAV